MITKTFKYFLWLLLIVVIIWACGNNKFPDNFSQSQKRPRIYPDYTELIIPSNIAPLNFTIKEEGEQFAVRITSKNEKKIEIISPEPKIQININDWQKLLSTNRGNKLKVEVFCKKQNNWIKFQTITHHISKDKIDNYLTYRLINSAYVLWFEMGLYQRNLENFDEDPIMLNKSVGGDCINCHSMSRNNPERFMFHIRGKNSGTIIFKDGILEKINTKTDRTLASAAYGSWHPNGRHIAFSINQINQNFYVFKDQSNEVSDKYSDLIVYDTETKTITTSPKISTKNRENLPEWSADGKNIYYISTKEAVDDSSRMITKYDLKKISYDIENNNWGDTTTVLSTGKTGKSITFPRTSPDGRYLVFCMTDYGYFTIHHKKSDLYILDLKTGKHNILKELNSNDTESYHSWSTNSKWLVFSSRRLDGIHTRTFIANVDDKGNWGKPFVVPQKDSEFYKNYLLNFNRPELMTEKIKISPQKIRDAALGNSIPATFDPKSDALSGATITKEKDNN